MKWQKLIVLALTALFTLLQPVTLLAADDEKVVYDARLEGYVAPNGLPFNVTLPSSSSGLLWILTILMLAICVGVLFKDAKRSHLD